MAPSATRSRFLTGCALAPHESLPTHRNRVDMLARTAAASSFLVTHTTRTRQRAVHRELDQAVLRER